MAVPKVELPLAPAPRPITPPRQPPRGQPGARRGPNAGIDKGRHANDKIAMEPRADLVNLNPLAAAGGLRTRSATPAEWKVLRLVGVNGCRPGFLRDAGVRARGRSERFSSDASP